MKRFLLVGMIVVLFTSLPLLEGQPGPFAIIRTLNMPADTFCMAASKKPVTLPELAQLVGRYYNLQVMIDQDGFQRVAPQMDLAKTRMFVPMERGLRLGTVLHYCLENELPIRATYKMGNQAIMIYPGETKITQDEDRTGPMANRLNASVVLPTKGFNGLLGVALSQLQARTGLIFLEAKRKFTEAGQEGSILVKEVSLPAQGQVPVAKALHTMLDRANATYQVKYDHILLVPKKMKR